MATILPLVLVAVLLLLALPVWPWSRGWGWAPAGIIAIGLVAMLFFRWSVVPE